MESATYGEDLCILPVILGLDQWPEVLSLRPTDISAFLATVLPDRRYAWPPRSSARRLEWGGSVQPQWALAVIFLRA
jgi:hypothetical protein